jgi:hypothetical protein
MSHVAARGWGHGGRVADTGHVGRQIHRLTDEFSLVFLILLVLAASPDDETPKQATYKKPAYFTTIHHKTSQCIEIQDKSSKNEFTSSVTKLKSQHHRVTTVFLQ